MITDLRLQPKVTTSLEIAMLVKTIPIEQGAELIEQYARTVAAGARLEAREEVYERALRIQNAPLGKEGD